MRLFGPLYERTLHWARHRHAARFLFGLSLVEAFVFPVPPEVMLAPMCLAAPRRGWYYAGLSLVGSVMGMFVGYAIGYYAIELTMPWLARLGYAAQFDAIKQQAIDHGFWLLLLAGFTPVPFKIFTLASGAVAMPLLPFFFGALIGRGKRVYLVAGAIRVGGEKAENKLRQYIEPAGWSALVLLAAALTWLMQRGA